jgi:hypothetical protein
MIINQRPTTNQIIDSAFITAVEKAYEARERDTTGSNGSEAWQAVQVKLDGRSKVAKELLNLGFEKDYYWGIIISPRTDDDKSFNNYFAEEAWTTEFARALNVLGIPAKRVERLL